MFVLTAQRHSSLEEPGANFRRYREYLEQHRSTFPPGAFSLATSEWYFDFSDRRCPHDAWLEQAVFSEPGAGARGEARVLSLQLRLLGAYHDGHHEFRYPQVFRYQLEASDSGWGHRDWRYDEFRVSDEGRLIHEIEWWGPGEVGRWLIEADDVEHRWIPAAEAATAGVRDA